MATVLLAVEVDTQDYVVSQGDAAAYVLLQLANTRAVSDAQAFPVDSWTPQTQWRIHWGEGDHTGPRDEEYARSKSSAKHGDVIETRTLITARTDWAPETTEAGA